MHRDRAGARGGHREEQPVPQRSAALRDGDDAGEQQCGRDRRAEQRADGGRARDEDRDLRGTCGSKRAKRATVMATLIAMIGFSGPRLTPPARLRTVTSASPGSTRSRSGGAMSSVVARIGPAVAGQEPKSDPTARPVSVRIRTIHQPFGSTPSASGSVSQKTPLSRSASCSRPHRRNAASAPITIAGIASSSSCRGDAPPSVGVRARLIVGSSPSDAARGRPMSSPPRTATPRRA